MINLTWCLTSLALLTSPSLKSNVGEKLCIQEYDFTQDQVGVLAVGCGFFELLSASGLLKCGVGVSFILVQRA